MMDSQLIREELPISVIIPVYNVEEWLDQCLETVTGQTFKDFEVLLINDGSSDGSDKKCREWSLRDKRIRYISKKNEGLSLTRNLGIQKAAGKYLVFIDADDWVDKTFLEKLYLKIKESGSDIAECDIWRFNDISKDKTYNSCYGHMGIRYTLEQHMKFGNTAIWKCMFKRTLFTDNRIEFPDCHSPARAIYPLLLALSNGIENVQEPLYYYRRLRKGSLSEKPRHQTENELIGIQAFECLLMGFERCGLYDKYGELLEETVKYKLSDMLAALFPRRSAEAFQNLVLNYEQFIRNKFPDSCNMPYITLGGYNLNRILWQVNLLHNPYCRFNFSSIISLMRPLKRQAEAVHKNKYREIMINRDICAAFWKILEEVKPEFICIDFIEERFDILELEGGYITKSDALDEAEFCLEDCRLIKRDSRECQELWERSCSAFTDKLKELIPPEKIILVKNYLSEKVGDACVQKEFENIVAVREVNKRLEYYYNFFSAQFCNGEDIKIVEASESEYYYTDIMYEYGAIPSHLNEIVNHTIAGKIGEMIGL